MQVTIDDGALGRLLRQAVENELAAMLKPDWNGKTPRYPVITNAVEQYLSTVDLTPLMERALAEHAPEAVADAVNQVVRARVGKMMGALVQSGALDARIAAILGPSEAKTP